MNPTKQQKQKKSTRFGPPLKFKQFHNNKNINNLSNNNNNRPLLVSILSTMAKLAQANKVEKSTQTDFRYLILHCYLLVYT